MTWSDDHPIVDPARIDANWRAIIAELDAPRRSIAERALRRFGLPTRLATLVAATPALRRAWYLAIALAVLVGLGAADPAEPRQSLFTLLVLAPLLPVLGVALAYGPSADPVHELQLATPLRGLRLIAIRSITVLAVSAMVIVLASLLSPVARPMAAAWLLPAIAVTSASLALMTIMAPRRAASIAAVGWVVVASVARGASTDVLAAFAPAGQVVALAATIVCLGIIAVRHRSFELMSVPA